ncbi:HEAT repeat domain-containing protein [Actinocorallia lasiicapitis]
MIMSELGRGDASERLQRALAAGTSPDDSSVDALVARCAVEPDFFVRDMLTWALTRHSAAVTVPRLLTEVRDGTGQARSQALHTLSKIGDRRAWTVLTPDVLTDPDDEVARAAWRAAVLLVPDAEKAALAAVLATQLGRGGRDTRLSLSQALVGLGEVILPVLRAVTGEARQHADVTERLLADPELGFEAAVEEAKRVVALGEPGC